MMAVWPTLLLAIFPLYLSELESFGTLGFGLHTADPCLDECNCLEWDTASGSRFLVNCTGMKFGLVQGMNIPRGLPFKTTDLIVSEYLLGTLSMNSFPNFDRYFDFSLNPMLLNVSLKGCFITYLSSDTFQGSSFVSIRNITISDNMFELLPEGIFRHLPYVDKKSTDRSI